MDHLFAEVMFGSPVFNPSQQLDAQLAEQSSVMFSTTKDVQVERQSLMVGSEITARGPDAALCAKYISFGSIVIVVSHSHRPVSYS